MIFSLLRNGGFSTENILIVLLTIPSVMLSLSFHESAHGYIAYKLGDPTARCMGRVTLNPLKHLEPMGMISMLLFGIGWAKPVPINPNNFKNRKAGMALCGLAGPVSNLILAFFSMLLYKITAAIFLSFGALSSSAVTLEIVILYFFLMFAQMNIYLAIFNLIPVPPFDGSRIFYFILPEKYYFGIMRYERVIMMVVIVILYLGVLDGLLNSVSTAIINLFSNLIGLIPFL